MHKYVTAMLSALILQVFTQAAQATELPDFKSIIEKNSPAVVKILVSQKSRQEFLRDPFENQQIPEYLRRYFEFRDSPQRQRQSMGSGFIISRDGYIVTNHHVVEGAKTITVRLIDRREFEAEVVGLDPRSDLALLRVDAAGLPVLTLGAPGELAVGEWVVAIGSPFGLDYSATAGIVSAKGRSLPRRGNDNYVPFIQTDVAINPGNSGGPLFNLEGEVVGVNSQIYTRSGGSIGLSFAVPVSVVVNVVEQLKDSGQVTRGWLGVTIQDVDKNLAESFGLDKPVGALISQLQPGGPAEQSNVQIGDIIVEFDGQPIQRSSDLPHVVGLVRPGSVVEMKIVRDGKRITMKVEVGGLGADENPSVLAKADPGSSSGLLGLVVEEADQPLLQRLGINGGVVVVQVVPGKSAAQGGIQRGDVITRVGSSPIHALAAYERSLDQLKPGQSVPLRVIRQGAPLFIGLKLD